MTKDAHVPEPVICASKHAHPGVIYTICTVYPRYRAGVAAKLHAHTRSRSSKWHVLDGAAIGLRLALESQDIKLLAH